VLTPLAGEFLTVRAELVRGLQSFCIHTESLSIELILASPKRGRAV
jgi:hypothetical protein